MKVTDEGQRSQKMNWYLYLANYDTQIHQTWYQGTIQWAKSNEIRFLDFDDRSRSHHKVKGHRRGCVCVLWMFLVYFFFKVHGWEFADEMNLRSVLMTDYNHEVRPYVDNYTGVEVEVAVYPLSIGVNTLFFYIWSVLYQTGGHGMKCNRTKKHCCFHWELNCDLNFCRDHFRHCVVATATYRQVLP